jgi:peptide/nickel transport system permease protein
VRRYVVNRVAQGVLALVGLTLVAFVLVNLSGDPSYILLSPEVDEEVRAAFRRQRRLDRSWAVQYAYYGAGLLRGDFGTSFAFERPALQVVMERVPATLELTVAAMLVGLAVGVPSGIVAAVKRRSIVDRAIMATVLVGQSLPTFWLGILLIRLLSVNLGLLPVSGRGSLAHLVMPTVVLALWLGALLARITRSEMLEVLGQDFIRAARAKGVGEGQVTMRHALRNASLPIVTVLGLQLGTLLGGAVVTETVFAWPGVGTLLFDAILRKDYPVVLGATIFVATGFIVINLLLDLAYVRLDPRLRAARA